GSVSGVQTCALPSVAPEADVSGVARSAWWRLTEPLRVGKRKVGRARHVMWRLRRRSLRPPPPAPRLRPAQPAPLRNLPVVSVLTPVYDTDPKWLARARQVGRPPADAPSQP